MKAYKSLLFTVLILFAVGINTFATTIYRENTDSRPIGRVQLNYKARFSLILKPIRESEKNQFYKKLLNAAYRNYGQNVDVVNIVVALSGKYGGFITEYHVTGDVISLAPGIESLADQILSQISSSETVFLMGFYNLDLCLSRLGLNIIKKTGFALRQKGINVVETVDRDRVVYDLISDDLISDDAGAVVVNGTLSKLGNRVIVNLRVLDTDSGSIVTTASLELKGSEYGNMYDDIIADHSACPDGFLLEALF